MDAVVERSNIWRAYERVMRNKGAAGVDGLTVFEFKAWLQQHWPSVKAALLSGDYMPAAIRKVEIPKLNGGVRMLGIPTVLDRLIQQALLQILQPEFEPEFSGHSYGLGTSLRLSCAPLALVDPDAMRGKRCNKHSAISGKAAVGWLTLIWRSSLTG